MTRHDFLEKLDNRDEFSYSEMFPPARSLADDRNEERNSPVKWSWDCGLKLDYDGPILRVSSRFYPPHKQSAEVGEVGYTVERPRNAKVIQGTNPLKIDEL